MFCVQLMLTFKQTTRISASEALKSPYFASSADCTETANDSNLSSPSSSSSTLSETDHDETDEFSHDKVYTSSDVQ